MCNVTEEHIRSLEAEIKKLREEVFVLRQVYEDTPKTRSCAACGGYGQVTSPGGGGYMSCEACRGRGY